MVQEARRRLAARHYVEALRLLGCYSNTLPLMHCYAWQAYRDNYRLAFEDAEQAALLWRRSGLEEACRALPLGGRRAVGLNPNLRLYKCAPPGSCAGYWV